MAHFAHLLTEPHFMRKQHDVVSIAAVTIITEDFFRRSFFFMLSSYVLKGFLNCEYLVYQGSKTFFLTVNFFNLSTKSNNSNILAFLFTQKKVFWNICLDTLKIVLEFLETLIVFWNFWTP